MYALTRHWKRIAVTLIPLVFTLLHTLGFLHLGALDLLDDKLYDYRLQATMPKTLDERVVIIDLDEKSLSEVGRWPWGRDKLARLVDVLFEQQQIAVLGFDVVFAEPDTSSGLSQLHAMVQNDFQDVPRFADRVRALESQLDYDALFARALQNRPVVLGYYLNSGTVGHVSGVLPAPVVSKDSLKDQRLDATRWSGYGANIPLIAQSAPLAGFFNPIVDNDGVIRSLPMLAEFQGNYYESTSLAMFRVLTGMPRVVPGFAGNPNQSSSAHTLNQLLLQKGDASLSIPVDRRGTALLPYRGAGGVGGGSYRYISASDVLFGRLAPGQLKDKIILIGTTAPGLMDMRVTPVGTVYPGVEAHANMISGLLDNTLPVRPDYAAGYEVAVLLLAGLGLAFILPLLSALPAVVFSVFMISAMVGLNVWLYLSYTLVLPLAAQLVMGVTAFALNMSYGYFVESRSKRDLAQLFGTYVPPELVEEMLKEPDKYSMKAANTELTVMFCDMRGFTEMSERMEPTQLQSLLTGVFSRLTHLIRSNRGTIDKYMGDCVMAFWGAPVQTPHHASLVIKSALEMIHAMDEINLEHRHKGLPEIGIGIGVNTGLMCVGDMGSNIRRSYTVIGDAVNLGSRLESLSKLYGVGIVVSECTRMQAPDFVWQELDRVRVKGKADAVRIFTPLPLRTTQYDTVYTEELNHWSTFLVYYREQQWQQASDLLSVLLEAHPTSVLYRLYLDRIANLRSPPHNPAWDGVTQLDTK